MAICIRCRRTKIKVKQKTENTNMTFEGDEERRIQKYWNAINRKLKIEKTTKLNENEFEILEIFSVGNYGKVENGIWTKVNEKPESFTTIKKVKVAMKSMKNSYHEESVEHFIKEIKTLSKFNASHIVKFFGWFIRDSFDIYMVMEFMEHGDLKTFLRKNRPVSKCSQVSFGDYQLAVLPTRLEIKPIEQMALEIADGMMYLESLRFIHRDLAARNCLVASDFTIKIGDFGMAQDIYAGDYYEAFEYNKMPVRWMAPESLENGKYSSKSDVYSFGVLLWEIVTYCETPYKDLLNEEVRESIINGILLEKPENCDDFLYELMGRCWKHNYDERIKFLEIITSLLPHESENFRANSFYYKVISNH